MENDENEYWSELVGKTMPDEGKRPVVAANRGDIGVLYRANITEGSALLDRQPARFILHVASVV